MEQAQAPILAPPRRRPRRNPALPGEALTWRGRLAGCHGHLARVLLCLMSKLVLCPWSQAPACGPHDLAGSLLSRRCGRQLLCQLRELVYALAQLRIAGIAILLLLELLSTLENRVVGVLIFTQWLFLITFHVFQKHADGHLGAR